MSDLIRRLKSRDNEGLRTGVVTAVSTAEGLDVLIGGGLVTGLQFLASYTAPGVGDVVAVLPMPGRMLVLGKYGTSGGNLGPNLLPNPGFEFGGSLPSSWITAFPKVIRVEDEATSHASSASVQFEFAGDPVATARNIAMGDAIAVGPGVTYRIGAWFWSPVADPNVSVRIRIATGPTPDDAVAFDPEGSYVVVASDTARSTWTEVAGVRTIPVDHFYARIFLAFSVDATPSTTAVHVDDVSMREQI